MHGYSSETSELQSLLQTANSFMQTISNHPNRIMHLRGAKLLKPEHYSNLAKEACAEDKLKPNPCMGIWDLPYESASRNFLFCGLQGTGKSTLINILMKSVLHGFIGVSELNHRALIHDHKGDSIPLMYGMGFTFENQLLKTLNPFDERSVYWDLAKDFDNDIFADILAEILIPKNENSPQPEFPDAAREIVAGVVKVLNDNAHHAWNFAELIAICTTCPIENLVKILNLRKENLSITEILTSPAQVTSAGILFTLRSHLVKFKPIASLWATKSEGITVSHFLRNNYVLLLGSFSSAEEAVQTVNKLFVTRLLETFLTKEQVHTLDQSNPNRTWLILDEGTKVGHLKKLPDALDLGRQMGLSVIFAFHDIPQLKAVYSEITYSLLAKFHNRYILKLGDDESKEWASNLFGTAEVLEIVPNIDFSRGRKTIEDQTLTGGNESLSYSLNVTTREYKLVLPSEFGNLPLVTAKTGICGFLSTVIGQTKIGIHWKGIEGKIPKADPNVLGRKTVDLDEIRFPEFPHLNKQENS